MGSQYNNTPNSQATRFGCLTGGRELEVSHILKTTLQSSNLNNFYDSSFGSENLSKKSMRQSSLGRSIFDESPDNFSRNNTSGSVVGNTREREGIFASNHQLSNGIHLIVRKGQSGPKQQKMNADDDDRTITQPDEVDIDQLLKEEKEERKNPFYQEATQKVQDSEYQDDFAVVSEENKIGLNQKSRKERRDIDQTLNILVTNNLEQGKVKELFRDYKKVSLKDKLNDLKSKQFNMARIQKKIKKESDFEDPEKVNRYMTQICNQKGVTIGKVLNIDEKVIEYVQVDPNEDLEKPQVKALEVLAELIEDQEEEKNQIRIFKQSQLDNMDADAARNKFNMTSFKKKNEQTEKLYKQLQRNNKRAILDALIEPQLDPNRFSRVENKVKPPSEKINVFRRLTSSFSGTVNGSNTTTERQRQLSTFQINPLSLQTKDDVNHNKLEQAYLKLTQKQNQTASPLRLRKQLKDTSPNISLKQIDGNRQGSQSSTSMAQIGQQISTPLAKQTILQSNYVFPNSTPRNRGVNFSMLSTDLKPVFFKAESVSSQTISTRKLHSSILKSRGSSHDKIFSSRYSQPEVDLSKNNEFNLNTINKNSQNEKHQSQKLKIQINLLKDNNQFKKAKLLEQSVNKIESAKYLSNFMDLCQSVKEESNLGSKQTAQKINELEKIIDDQIKDVNQQRQGELNIESKVENYSFKEFIKRADFKRNLTKFLVQKVSNKNDLFSRFQSKQFTSNFFQKLNEKEQLTPMVE